MTQPIQRSVMYDVPDRSLAQRMEALAEANDVRAKRAELKRDLKSGRLAIDKILKNPPDWVKTMKVFDMVLACPKYGKVKTNKILTQCRISSSKTVGGLSYRQRDELCSML